MEPLIEAVLILSPAGSSRDVEVWAARHGLTWTSLRSGLLLAGHRRVFESAFAIDLRGATAPLDVPVPAELRDAAASVIIPRSR